MRLVGIYSKNRLEWFITDWACALFGFTVVPLYDTLGADNLAYCIEMTGLTSLFVSCKTAAEVCKFKEKGSLKTLIVYD
jgi:long-chain acyl-CoA synthetase